MNIEVARINNAINSDPLAFVRDTNKDYLYKLENIAKSIASTSKERPVILLSGPSGSGKTTTALMLERLLDNMGHETHTISMDNYFCPLTQEEKELAALGKMDLESPLRVDKKLLNQQIEAISNCEEVNIPKYNFKSSTRDGIVRTLKRKPGELVIFEGIHALNPDVITVEDKYISKIYVSVRTRVTSGDVCLHPSRVRLMRRMIRDKKFRDRSLRETMNMYPSVESGENKYIMPYKNRSDYDIDTFMAYEISAYRETLIEQLREMRDVPELKEAINVLEKIVPIDERFITPDSLICEFLGNSEYVY